MIVEGGPDEPFAPNALRAALLCALGCLAATALAAWWSMHILTAVAVVGTLFFAFSAGMIRDERDDRSHCWSRESRDETEPEGDGTTCRTL